MTRDMAKVSVVIFNFTLIICFIYTCILSLGSLALLLFLLLLNLLEHLDLLIILLQLLLEVDVVLIWFGRRPVILIRLLLFLDLNQVGSHPADEGGIGSCVDLLYLAVDYPEALLVMPPDAIQHLQPLALRR